MTEDRLPLAELLQKAGEGDFLRSVAEAVLQILMEADVEGLVGAGRHERSPERLNYRNGYRDRVLDTRLGSLQLRVPKLRQGSYFPPFLEPRKTSEKALVAVIQEAWIGGVSTRRVEDLGSRPSTWWKFDPRLRWPSVRPPWVEVSGARRRDRARRARPWPRAACSGAGAATRRSARAARPRSVG